VFCGIRDTNLAVCHHNVNIKVDVSQRTLGTRITLRIHPT